MGLDLDSVMIGKLKEVKLTGVYLTDVVDYLLKRGYEQLSDLDTNGWQWDFWQGFMHGTTKFTCSGSGFYGQLKFYKDDE